MPQIRGHGILIERRLSSNETVSVATGIRSLPATVVLWDVFWAEPAARWTQFCMTTNAVHRRAFAFQQRFSAERERAQGGPPCQKWRAVGIGQWAVNELGNLQQSAGESGIAQEWWSWRGRCCARPRPWLSTLCFSLPVTPKMPLGVFSGLRISDFLFENNQSGCRTASGREVGEGSPVVDADRCLSAFGSYETAAPLLEPPQHCSLFPQI
jgi:hypothetical protein